MNKQLVIETLSPVHIGNGRVLLGGIDHLVFSNEKRIAVLDDKKVMQVLGANKINAWVASINRGESVRDLLTTVDRDLNSEKVAMRYIHLNGINIPAHQNNIREQIHAGNSKPMIPGSSLKGSFRTSWFRKEVLRAGQIDRNVIGQNNFNRNLNRQVFKFSQKELNGKLLGKDPNHDVFRLLRLDDYSFEGTICLKAETLNQTGMDRWQMKDEVSQFIECIPAGSLSVGRLNIAEDLKRQIINSNERLPGDKEFTLEALFNAINKQTLLLIEREIKLWTPRLANLPKAAENFIDELNRLKVEVENAMASDFQAVARLGFASGFESLTGGWQSDVLTQDVQKEIAHAVRRREYGDMPFPKSRRIVNGGTPVGFVKLTLMDHDKAERYLKDHNQNKESQKLKEMEEHAMKLAEVERLKEAARQPLPFVGKLKPGIKVEGVITGNKEGIALAKFVIHDETIEVLMRGLSNPEIGSIVIASVPQLAGGKIKEVKFVGFKK